MEKLSRVKKYEDLRKTIDTGTEEIQNNKTESFNQDLSDINASLIKKMKQKEEPSHAPEREKIVKASENEHPANDFQNEYLDDFLNEVKQYNLKKGTRDCEDTQIDILHQLQPNHATRSHYVEDIHEDKAASPDLEEMMNSMSNEDIAKEVKNLLDDTTKQKPLYKGKTKEDQKVSMKNEIPLEPAYEENKPRYREEPIYQEPIAPLSRNYAPLEESVMPMEDEDTYEQEAQRENLLHQKLVEETQQLRRQLDEYEDELTDLSDGVEKNNRILNVILCCLILALLGVIIFVIVMLVKAGGTL